MRKVFALLMVCSIQQLQAQPLTLKAKKYAGIHAGSGNYGVAVRYCADRLTAIDGIISVNPAQHKTLLTGLYEQFYRVKRSSKLKWYAGLGMHIGYIRRSELQSFLADTNKENGAQETITKSVVTRKMVAGADAIIGLEYSLKSYPVSIGINTKPYMDFVNNSSQLFNCAIRIGYQF